MTTWHVTVHYTVGSNSLFQNAIQTLVLKPYQQHFLNAGFTVNPMPESSSVAFSVSHSSETAMTLFMLKHDVSDLIIEAIS